ncbi:M23 family metallopeptidase [Chloroflexi bacterium CFX6]|nr:M23 family metallopeptidase [Chloroflexi bacterium CFX6]
MTLILLLASCAPAIQPAAAESVPSMTLTPFPISQPESTPTFIIPSPTVTQVACDPFVEDFCITDGRFLFQNPILPPGNASVDTTYRYGSTQNGTREPHHGVEFLNRFGTPVHAAGDGAVQFAGPDKEAIYGPWADFYGNVVVIRHADEMYTLYAHLSKMEVQAGDEVKAGDVIGEVGQSGVATGSHLHFEVRKGGDGTDYFSTLNPELWLKPNKDETGNLPGAISFSILDRNSNFVFAEFTARFHLDKNEPKIKSHYVVTYAKDMMVGEENAALGDLPPGFYRVALKYNGQIYERWVEVESGKLTQVVFVVK